LIAAFLLKTGHVWPDWAMAAKDFVLLPLPALPAKALPDRAALAAYGAVHWLILSALFDLCCILNTGFI
jgi:hypothetical protein